MTIAIFSILITYHIKESELFLELVGLGSNIASGSLVPLLVVGKVIAFSAFGRTDIESNIGFIIAPNGL
jgi:branched-subunit amino acid transport protein AzlD